MSRSDKRSGPTPHAIIFDPSSNTTAHLAAVITSGKIIETADIDSVLTCIEDPGSSLFAQNGILFGGCIPQSQIQEAWTDLQTVLRLRLGVDNNDHPTGFVTGFSHLAQLPLYRQGIIQGTQDADTPTVEQLFPNFHIQHHNRFAQFGSNIHFSSYGGNVKYLPSGRIRVWSSFRVERIQSNGQRWFCHVPSLRPTFGYYARLFSTLHPSQRIP
jgi:hypothetical protein